MKIHPRIVLPFLIFIIVACSNNKPVIDPTTAIPSQEGNSTTTTPDEFQVTITGGHDTDPRDGGRPVVLIASALGVPSEVFREAFSQVQPASAGQEPNPIQVKLNKSALLAVLEPYGVTNDFLDTVSNYYRYNRSAGETWPQTPATASAIITDGVVTGFIITNPGSGYTSPPIVTLSGSNTTSIAILSFTTDFKTNGSLTAINLK